jgi:S-layer family protein
MTVVLLLMITASRLRADTGTCGGQLLDLPFSDVMGVFFCEIAEVYFLDLVSGYANGTYRPLTEVTRGQLAKIIARTHDSALKRGSHRAALGQWWTTKPHYSAGFNYTTGVGNAPTLVQSDGTDLWVVNSGDTTISRVKASDGKVLDAIALSDNIISVNAVFAPLVALNHVFVTATASLSSAPSGPALIFFSAADPAGTLNAIHLNTHNPKGIAFDGNRIWVAGTGLGVLGRGGLDIIDVERLSVTSVSTGFVSPEGLVYDGDSIWVTDPGDNRLKKVDKTNGVVLNTIPVGESPLFPIFDGTNIWVPSKMANTITVVSGSTGLVLATLNSNGLNGPTSAAFDGQRIVITNILGDSVSLWKADSLTPIGVFSTGAGSAPLGACSDGIDFWLTLQGTSRLARF